METCLNTMNATGTGTGNREALSTLITLAGERGLATGLLHRYNVAFLRLREALQSQAMLACDWEVAHSSALAIHQVYEAVYPRQSPVVALQTAVLGKLELYLAEKKGQTLGTARVYFRSDLNAARWVEGGNEMRVADQDARGMSRRRQYLVQGLQALGLGVRELRMTFGASHRLVANAEEVIRQVELDLSGLGGFAK